MDKWLKLLHSRDPVIRKRAAEGLLQYYGETVPLPALLDIFDELSDKGLGAAVERILMKRRDSDLFEEMLLRLESPSEFVREVACRMLGTLGDRRATPDLLARLDDRALMVRRAAAVALERLKDPISGPAIRHHYATRSEDINVRMALESALVALDLLRRRPVTPELESGFGKLLRAGKERDVIEGLHREAGFSFDEAKEWIRDYRCQSLREPERPCPYCGKPLRTNQARQCFKCGRDWHDSGAEPDAYTGQP